MNGSTPWHDSELESDKLKRVVHEMLAASLHYEASCSEHRRHNNKAINDALKSYYKAIDEEGGTPCTFDS